MDHGRMRLGIAGLGRLGRRHALNLARRCWRAELMAACSPLADEREWARTQLGIERTYDSVEALLGDPQIDAVILVTPTSMHAEQTIAALRAGKHVFVEKPLALQVEDCERVEAVARQHAELVAMVGFVRRFDPSYQQVHADIAEGRLGRPFLVRSQTCDMNDPDGFFVRFAPSSGGLFMDCSVHDIDLARWLLGGPRALRVYASGTVAMHEGLRAVGDVDNGLAVIEFEGGQRAMLYASRTMPHGHETTTEVIGTAGVAQVGYGAARDRVVMRDACGVSHRSVLDFHERFSEAFALELDAFIDACLGRAAPPLQLADATEATRIGQAITRSLHSGAVEQV